MTKKPSDEYSRFEDALRHVLSVPKAEVMAKIEQERKPREKRKPKTSADSGQSSNKS